MKALITFLIVLLLSSICFAEEEKDEMSELYQLLENAGIKAVEVFKDVSPELWEMTRAKVYSSAKINLYACLPISILIMSIVIAIWFVVIIKGDFDEGMIIPCIFITVALIFICSFPYLLCLDSIKTLYAMDFYTLKEIISIIK